MARGVDSALAKRLREEKWKLAKLQMQRPEVLHDLGLSETVVPVILGKGRPPIPPDVLIFFIPEFWDDSGSGLRETFRIDSAYFHRVTAEPHHRTSAKTSRSVLSFHLLKSRWRAAIFDYGSGYKADELEDRIQSAVTSHFTQTIRLYLINHLPASRILPEELFNEIMSLHDESILDQMMALG